MCECVCVCLCECVSVCACVCMRCTVSCLIFFLQINVIHNYYYFINYHLELAFHLCPNMDKALYELL